MKPARPSRIRHVLKWAGLASCVALLIVDILSIYWLVDYTTYQSGYYVDCDLDRGALNLHRFRDPRAGLLAEGLNWSRSAPLTSAPLEGWLSHLFLPRVTESFSGPPAWFRMPLAPLIVVLWAATVFLWYRDRPVPPDHCRKCGYNLTGNVSGICPECGTAIGETLP